MREALDPWPFVAACYLVTIGGMLALLVWSWLGMRRAEKRREQARKG